MQVGDVIRYVPFVDRYKEGSKVAAKAVPCRVVWIHPLGRFAVVERETGIYSYRECVRCERKRNEVRNSENDSNHESEGRRGKDRHRPHFGRRAAPRREDFRDR